MVPRTMESVNEQHILARKHGRHRIQLLRTLSARILGHLRALNHTQRRMMQTTALSGGG